MKKSLFAALIAALFFMLSACTHKETEPVLTPPESVEQPVETPVITQPKVEKPAPIKSKTHSLGIIGEVEPIYFLPMKSAFLARIDTGAKGSSIDVAEVREFEREGKKWVSFELINRQTGEQQHYEKKLIRQATIKRQGDAEDRFVVMMTIRIGKEKLTVPFSLSDRSKFDYQALVGRNILKGRALVDTALSKTLY